MTGEIFKQIYGLLKEKPILFWDFDGVIKDSVPVKSKGYEKLFLPYGREILNRVNQHHQDHGGVSRYEKIPLYLGWAGQSTSPGQVQDYCDRYSMLVRQAVIDSPWVPGVHEYLRSNYSSQCFILMTGTPQKEIEEIIEALDLNQCFREVYGAPKTKAAVIRDSLNRFHYLPKQALVIGDSRTDFEAAAKENNVAFLLRCTQQNSCLQESYSGPRF